MQWRTLEGVTSDARPSLMFNADHVGESSDEVLGWKPEIETARVDDNYISRIFTACTFTHGNFWKLEENVRAIHVQSHCDLLHVSGGISWCFLWVKLTRQAKGSLDNGLFRILISIRGLLQIMFCTKMQKKCILKNLVFMKQHRRFLCKFLTSALDPGLMHCREGGEKCVGT